MTYFQFYDSPIGTLMLVADDQNLIGIEFEQSKHRLTQHANWQLGLNAVLEQTQAELIEYFAGARTTFSVVCKPEGTPFQRSVWQQLLQIPYGSTWSYGQVAHAIGRPTASRAVGAANGRNPIPIIIPCHRVIGAQGSLVGFGGGLAVKESLLGLERRGSPD